MRPLNQVREFLQIGAQDQKGSSKKKKKRAETPNELSESTNSIWPLMLGGQQGSGGAPESLCFNPCKRKAQVSLGCTSKIATRGQTLRLPSQDMTEMLLNISHRPNTSPELSKQSPVCAQPQHKTLCQQTAPGLLSSWASRF